MPFAASGGPDNDAIRELRDELKDLNINLKKNNKNTEQYSRRILAFTFILLFVGLGQLAIAIFGLGLNIISATGWVLFVVGAVFYMINDLTKDSKGN